MRLLITEAWLRRKIAEQGDDVPEPFACNPNFFQEINVSDVTKVRCKFKVTGINSRMGSKQTGSNPNTWEPCEMWDVMMAPVYGASDKNHENTRFWNATPSGEFRMGTVNAEAVKMFKLDEEYYIDITPAPRTRMFYLNGELKTTDKPALSAEDIETLVYGDVKEGRNPSITWLKPDKTDGSLCHGQSVLMAPDLKINCMVTGNA